MSQKSKKGFKDNIEKLTLGNENFRKVLYTGGHSQLVLMTLQAQEDIGLEIHKDTDQFFRFEAGEGLVLIDDNEYVVGDGDAGIVPAGSKHNVVNTSKSKLLKFYTIYSPAHHKDGIVRDTKADAIRMEAEFDGIITE